MKQNVGGMDHWVRLALGVALVGYGYATMTRWMMIVGVIVFLTGIFRFCGPYTLLGISTCPIEPKSDQ